MHHAVSLKKLPKLKGGGEEAV